MKSSRRIVVIALSVALLLVGVVLGFLPVKATLTEIEPQVRLVTVACGNGYLQTTPPVQPGDLVALPGESGVYLPRASYAQHCAQAAGWKRYAAWGLTALGALGLAITFSARGVEEPAGRGAGVPAARRRGESDSESDSGTESEPRTRDDGNEAESWGDAGEPEPRHGGGEPESWRDEDQEAEAPGRARARSIGGLRPGDPDAQAGATRGRRYRANDIS